MKKSTTLKKLLITAFHLSGFLGLIAIPLHFMILYITAKIADKYLEKENRLIDFILNFGVEYEQACLNLFSFLISSFFFALIGSLGLLLFFLNIHTPITTIALLITNTCLLIATVSFVFLNTAATIHGLRYNEFYKYKS